MKRFGYTLSEVLVTLGIIGVISALAVPSLVNEYNKQVYVKTLQVAISDFENAMQAMMMKEGVLYLHETEAWRSTFSQNQYKLDYHYSNANTIKNFASHIDKVLPIKEINTKRGNILGLKNNVFFNPPGVGLITNKDVEYFFDIGPGWYDVSEKELISRGKTSNGTVGYLVIDVNGEKKPNRYGRDTFRYFISRDGLLQPDHYDADFESVRTECKTVGDACAEYLRQNNYKMDY